MILLNGLITNDKFCLSRISPSRLSWARRPPRRRAHHQATTGYFHNDSEHCGGAYETSVAHKASIAGEQGRSTAVGSRLPTPASVAQRAPGHAASSPSSATRAITVGGSR